MADEDTLDFMDQLEELDRPQVEKREWMDSKKMELVRDLDHLRQVVDECIAAKIYAWDIETTGLDKRVFPGPQKGRTVDRIVGHCLSPDGNSGYYVPLRHKTTDNELLDCNLPIEKANDELRRLADSDAVAVFHNAKFDLEFLEFGEDDPIGSDWDNPDKWHCTLILTYLRNTRERQKGLKFLAKQDLGMEMIELEDLFDEEARKKKRLDFSTLDPEWDPVVWYATSDAICTRLLFDVLHPVIVSPEPHGTSQSLIYKLERKCLTATRWMERCRINIDRDKVEELIRLGQAEWFDSLEEVYQGAKEILGRDLRPGWYRLMRGVEDVGAAEEYRFKPDSMAPNYQESRSEAIKYSQQLRLDPTVPNKSGKEKVRTTLKEVPDLANPKKKERVAFPVVYDVTIPAELGLLLRELGVQGLQTTAKSGQVATGADILDRVIADAEDQFPFMGKVKRFRETSKALGTNLFPIWWDTSKEHSPDGTIWVGFNGHKVDTGRFSTPQPRDKKVFRGQVRWNLHSIPATYDTEKPQCMIRIREAVKARPNHVMFAIDYAGVELRIVTNLSREPKWLDEFFRCGSCGLTFDRGMPNQPGEPPPYFCPRCGSDKIGDLHSLTAFAVYGEGIKGTKEFKNLRKKAKGLNFAMCYGGGGMAAQRAVKVDKDEGWRIKRQFDKTYTGLRGWWEMQHNFARRYEYVVTAMGRRYPVPDITHENGRFRSKAERNSVNGPVQGSSADFTKLAMALCYEECKERGWLERVLMTITIHDELVFEIEEEIAEEAAIVLRETMTNSKPIQRLKLAVPLLVDMEFGRDWTVPYDLTKLRYGKKPWTEELARIFPKSYAMALEHGAEPLEGVEAPKVSPEPESGPETASEGPAAVSAPSDREVFEMPETGKGKSVVHVVHSSRLSYGLMDRVARLIVKCEGRGTQHLRIETEKGEVLWDDPDVTVNAGHFKVLAEEYGV